MSLGMVNRQDIFDCLELNDYDVLHDHISRYPQSSLRPLQETMNDLPSPCLRVSVGELFSLLSSLIQHDAGRHAGIQ
jgi:hypothetical protein